MKKISMMFMLLILIISSNVAMAGHAILWKKYSPDVVQRAKTPDMQSLFLPCQILVLGARKWKLRHLKMPQLFKMINENFYPVILHADQDPVATAKYQLQGVPVVFIFRCCW